MANDSPFLELLRRVRAGDADAATEFVRRYEPHVRRVVRIRLADSDLRRLLDSADICQSVFGLFFVRAALGQFDLETPDQLLRLLTTIARNRITNHVEHHRAAKRDQRRVTGQDVGELGVVSHEKSPGSVAADRELIERILARLSPEEREIAQLRGQGATWNEVAEKVGGTAESQRKRYGRAIDQAALGLGLDETS